jgi:hypothetical protein
MRSGLVFSRVPTINVYIHEGCQPWRKYTFIVLHSSLPPPYTPPYTFHLTHSSLPPPMNWLEGNDTTLYKKRHCNTLQHTVRDSTHNVATLCNERPPFKKHPTRGLSHMREVHSFVATYTRRGLVSKKALLHVRGVFPSLTPYTKKTTSCT